MPCGATESPDTGALVGRRLLIAFALVACVASRARAEGLVTPFIGFSFGGDAANCISLLVCDERRVNWGISLASVHGVVGFEEDIGYAPDFFGKTSAGDNAVLTVMSNLMVQIPTPYVRPYVLFGVGFVRPHVHLDSSALTAEGNAVGWDVGGGVNVILLSHLGVRGDVRRIRTFSDLSLGIFSAEQLDFWRGSVGLTVRF